MNKIEQIENELIKAIEYLSFLRENMRGLTDNIEEEELLKIEALTLLKQVESGENVTKWLPIEEYNEDGRVRVYGGRSDTDGTWFDSLAYLAGDEWFIPEVFDDSYDKEEEGHYLLPFKPTHFQRLGSTPKKDK